ncbi:MAG: hypothetical protein R3240_14380, partial [Gammaproteobacteria bacterium]|nr:hypothetical protein [Gammaproteobacteria bacterium]
TSGFKMASERFANSGGVSASIFLDDNNNGIRDENESVVEGAKVAAVQARKNGKTDKNGEVFFPGLPVDRRTDVELDMGSLSDPFLISTKPGYSFVPRPGLVEKLEIPLVTSGEVEGTVYLTSKNGTFTREAGHVPMELVSIKNRKTYTTASAFDGYYLFTQVPPGRYLLAVNRKYLEKRNLTVQKPMPVLVEVAGDGSVVMGMDVMLFTKNNAYAEN